jgi:hypothetical protein
MRTLVDVVGGDKGARVRGGRGRGEEAVVSVQQQAAVVLLAHQP